MTGQSREIGIGSVFETIRWTRHLQSLAGLVLLSAASTVFLDYVFKAEAGRRYPDANELLAFFACFYTAAAFLTFLFQITIANLSIERLGLGKTAGSLPLTVASGQLLLIWLPGLFVGAMARGGEIVLRSSLFRSAYELFFTPLREKDRRRTKLLIDVGAERLGDAAGGSLLVLLLGLPISSSRTIVLLTGAMIALGAGYLALRLQRSYVSTLAARVMSGAVRIPESEQPAATRLTLFQSLLEIPTSLPADLRDSAPYEARARRSGKSLETLEGLLESGDEEQVTRALRRPDVVAPSHTAALIRLLAWDAVAPLAGSVLIRIGPPACSQLAACLADTSEDFVIRRRIPGLLAHDACQSNADALLSGARDPRFEVRYRVAVALCRIRKKNAAVHLDRDELIRWILRELGVDRLVWHSRRPLEEDQEEDFEEAETDSRRPGASRSLRHVFNLLTLLLPEDKLTAALTAVRCGDVRLRGTALEYLESILPEEIWEKLAPWLGEEEAAGTTDR